MSLPAAFSVYQKTAASQPRTGRHFHVSRLAHILCTKGNYVSNISPSWFHSRTELIKWLPFYFAKCVRAIHSKDISWALVCAKHGARRYSSGKEEFSIEAEAQSYREGKWAQNSNLTGWYKAKQRKSLREAWCDGAASKFCPFSGTFCRGQWNTRAICLQVYWEARQGL